MASSTIVAVCHIFQRTPSYFLHFLSVPEDMVCQVLQDVISSNKTVHTISGKDAGYVKLIAGNPDKEFDGVRFPIISEKFGMVE